MKNTKKRHLRSLAKSAADAGTMAVLVAWALPTLFLLAWILNNSLKPSVDVMARSFAPAASFDLANYRNAFARVDVPIAYLNSILVSGLVCIVDVTLGGMAAYVYVRYDFPGKKLVAAALVGSWLIPVFTIIIPAFRIIFRLGLHNSVPGLALLQGAVNLPFSILVLAAYLRTLPREVEEAAHMDGAGPLRIFFGMVVPMTKPAFATVATFSFLWSYNDLFTSLVVMRKRGTQPVNVILNELSSQYGMDYGLMAAAVAIVVVPVVAFYLVAQKQVVAGLTAGAVKG